MKTYLTIDGGTSNTRINVVAGRKIVYTEKIGIGVGKAKDNPDLYRSYVKTGIRSSLEKSGVSKKDVIAVIASGMITSEYGLCNLPHITLPAGINELHESMYSITLDDITDIPFVFIRGIKSVSSDISLCDIMRGEETELFGLLKSEYGKCTYVLPGSHSKLITTDETGRIVSFSTMLTGELLYAVANSTILKDAIDLSLTEFDKEYLLIGYDLALKEGVNKALFKTRILKNIFGKSELQCYSFVLGVVLCDEISAIIRDVNNHIVIAGKKQLKQAMAHIISERTDKKLTVVDDCEVDASTVLGAVRIFENLI